MARHIDPEWFVDMCIEFGIAVDRQKDFIQKLKSQLVPAPTLRSSDEMRAAAREKLLEAIAIIDDEFVSLEWAMNESGLPNYASDRHFVRDVLRDSGQLELQPATSARWKRIAH